jgi:FecR protein
MSQSRSCIATDARLLLAAFCLATVSAAAAPAGTVTRSNGPLFAQNAEGRGKILAEGSAVFAGDTLVSGKGTFARIDLADRGTLTLGPDTQVAIDAFAFDIARPAEDRGEFSLVRGALQVASGSIARRGADRQHLKTPLGTISSGEATYVATYTPPDAATVAMWQPVRLASLSMERVSGTLSDAPPLQIAQLTQPAPPTGALAPGLYVQVIAGLIHVSNPTGTSNFAAGQFGYTASLTHTPVVVPANPGIQFAPPPQFSTSSAAAPSSSGKPSTVDCEVR